MRYRWYSQEKKARVPLGVDRRKARQHRGNPSRVILAKLPREWYQRRSRVISVARVTSVLLTLKMVRGLSQWTKTLSFPARVSPQRPAKETKAFHVSPSASPTSPPSPINDTMDKAPIITDEVRHTSFCLFFLNFFFQFWLLMLRKVKRF